MDVPLVRYRNVVMDNARWDGFEFRDGDIVISTPSKCGTTWTQMICALLVFKSPDFPDRLNLMSPWVDMLLNKIEDIHAVLEAQEHRRFIKSHTPLDGLPFDDRVTHITVARDPRDVAISWDHHRDNMDMDTFIAQRAAAVGLDDLAELMPDGIPVAPESEIDRFWQWMDGDTGFGGLADLVHHLDTFWQLREKPNVILLHYAELKADLEGQMRALAQRLAIEVPEDCWPTLVEAASFASMKADPNVNAAGPPTSIWKDDQKFFYSGTNGQWRNLLDDAGTRRYVERVRSLGDPDLLAWIHQSRPADTVEGVHT
jgi:hypothetical protein